MAPRPQEVRESGCRLKSEIGRPATALIDNDEVASFVREYPGRLIGVASVNLARPMEAVRELRRAGHLYLALTRSGPFEFLSADLPAALADIARRPFEAPDPLEAALARV